MGHNGEVRLKCAIPEVNMRFYRLSAGQATVFYNGDFAPPYPNLTELFLGTSIQEELSVVIRSGGRPGDMMFSCSNVVSDRLLDVLKGCSATGYQPFPVTVSAGETNLAYWGLKLLGRGGPFDARRSEATYGPDGEALFGYSCIYMDEDRWDGSDVFAIPGLGIGMFVTERVKEALEKAKLRNVRLVLNTDCYWGGPRLQAELQRIREEARKAKARRDSARS